MQVFHIKLEALLEDLTKTIVFGKVRAFTAMKEDQKRGLPHCHILIILCDEDKPREPNDIDRIVSAEIPDREVNPRLWKQSQSNTCTAPVVCSILPVLAWGGGADACKFV